MDLNKVMIIGRLTRDPEVKTTPSGQNVANFSLATSFKWKDKAGEQKEKTEFHNIVAWRKLAEIIGQYLKKGSQIYLEGRLETRNWEGDDGKKRYRTEIIADNMIMLGRASGTSSASGAPATNMTIDETTSQAPKVDAKGAVPKEEEISIEDIPF